EVLGSAGALADEVARRDAKLKELEQSSAERWVRIQRLEHELKTLDEDARKARDRAAKVTKDLDDERKLRQRIELDAQMARRAPELPRPTEAAPEREAADEIRFAELERKAAAAQVAHETARARIAELERELDETRETEAALRGALDTAEQQIDAQRR